MNIYETTMEYNREQILYLIIMYENHLGYTGFCVDTKVHTSNKVNEGTIIYNIPKEKVKISEYDIKNSPLQDNYLLDYYIKNYGELF
jgi:hypothetical protein